MKITVIVCTFDRCQSLAKTLESIGTLESPEPHEWEVVVVDNNSRDQTRTVVEDFCRRYPGRFRYIFESKQGKSYALNTGVREAKGDVLAFTDDDVIADGAWLRGLTAGLVDSDEWAGAGGRTLPKWECPPPNWLRLKDPYALAPFAVFDLGTRATQLNEPPFGANMAFRRAMFEKYGGFRTDLAGSDNLFRNEDTEFGDRLLTAGEMIRYEPSAVGFHPVSRERLQKKYLLKWWFDKGRADIRQFGLRPRARYFVRGVPLYMFRNLAAAFLRWVFTFDPGKRFHLKLKVFIKLGEMSECNRKSRIARTLTESNACT
jgi:glucosyl-dolichyl phosphate glucuronosyltransferase